MPADAATRKPWYRPDGLTRKQRGYGHEWDKLRLVILQRDSYLCQCRYCQGGKIRVTPAQQVDHIKPKARGGTDAPSNLQAINELCHVRKTREENQRKHDDFDANGRLRGWA